MLYLGQIIYGSAPIARKLVDNCSQPNSNLTTLKISSSLAQFTNTHVVQSHEHMVQILRMLEFNVNNAGDDQPNSPKQAMYHTNWPKLKEAIQVEYDSLIENET